MAGISTRWTVHLLCYGLLAFFLVGALSQSVQRPYVLSESPLVDEANIRRMDCRLDPNVANWSELACLPEIGPALARRIVEYRDQHRASANTAPGVVYHTPEDLLAVTGIGPRKLASIRAYLRFPSLTAALTERVSSR